ncbi:MAG: HD domain-containing phosphohydrolase [Pseudomonadota bacterium]|nr:HD domain-containing phosphohydrolase [Pseudomonadota bacterium]
MTQSPLTNANMAYRQLSINTLVPNRQAGVKLFLRTGKNSFVLFINTTSHISAAKLEQLQQNNVKHLYLNTTDQQGYLNYLKENLSAILSNPELTDNDKAEIIYDTASSITEDLFLKPSTNGIKQTRNLVNCMIDTISHSPKTSKLLMMITSQDYYTYTHSINVGIYAISMMRKVKPSISDTELKTLGLGFFLHDLGKTRIPNTIINKQGPLDQFEWQLMQEHPMLGVELVHKMGEESPAITDIILTHHERNCGSGYPGKLTRNEISLPGKICALCDVFDALTTKRPYKKALSTFESLKLMKNEHREQFDMELLNQFIILFT